MRKYTAISIGPILKTLLMARKPRELWIASYLFSYLMECIIDSIISETDAEIISPAKLNLSKDQKVGLGLYPDRIFIRINSEFDAKKVLRNAKEKFCKNTELNKECVDDYFHIMHLTLPFKSDKEAVPMLNKHLDCLEMIGRPVSAKAITAVSDLVKNVYTSPLYLLARGKRSFSIGTLAELATYQLSVKDNEKWKKARTFQKISDQLEKDVDDEYKLIVEEQFYTTLKQDFLQDFKSHHKYICVVQADGDNVGTVISKIEDGELKKLSELLLTFGVLACEKISDYGGLPIYAGGDDLLFIAPVSSTIAGSDEKPIQKHILDLIADIDSTYSEVKEKVADYNLKDEKENIITTGMTYGVSITYYKFPLYESLASAKDLLFTDAKKVENKDAIAWKLQKHSGGSFQGNFSKSEKKLATAFQNLIGQIGHESLISAVAHKMRNNVAILELFVGGENEENRLDAFFEKYLEYNDKTEAEQKYLECVKCLFLMLYGSAVKKKEKRIEGAKSDKEKAEIESEMTKREIMEDAISELYGMLRTAKFLKGEEDNHG